MNNLFLFSYVFLHILKIVKLLPLLLISLLLNLFFAYKSLHPRLNSDQISGSFTVTKVIDGDTFDIENGQRIRLALIDAPELDKGCLARDSKNRLETLILNKKVAVHAETSDNFGRIIAFVSLNGLSINKALLTEGYAKYDKNKKILKSSAYLEQAESEAKSASRGIWSSNCQTHNPDCSIKGNYRKDNNTKIYHTPDCYNYEKIIVNEKEKDVWFCSEESALSAGFTKSLDCP